MNGTFYALDQLQSASGFMISALLGMLFGFFLEQAGFGSSRRLTAVFYLRDMTVVKVMFTGLLVCLVGTHYLTAFGWLPMSQVYPLDTYWLAQIVGGLLFGAGFVIGGWCPGTALVGLASAKLDALVFLGGVILGSIIFNEIFGLIQPLYEGAAGGTLFLYDSLDMPPRLLIFVICLVAVAVFAGSTWVERIFGKAPKTDPAMVKKHLGAGLLLLLFAAGLFLSPVRPPAPAVHPPRVAGFLQEVASAADHLDPLQLAESLIKGAPGLTLVDLRSPEEYGKFHIRGAVNIPLEKLPAQADALLKKEGQVVLYSNGTTHAAQAWLEMRRWGWPHVKVLTDGLLGFWRECLTPPSLTGFTDEQVAREQFGAFAARRDFFLGQHKGN